MASARAAAAHMGAPGSIGPTWEVTCIAGTVLVLVVA
jgi:hypothetical protein